MTAQVATTLSPEQLRAYDTYVVDNHGDLSDVVHFGQVMFNAGARQAVAAMVVFGDVLPRLSNMEDRIAGIRAVLLSLQECGQ